jgi:hypothetical protein
MLAPRLESTPHESSPHRRGAGWGRLRRRARPNQRPNQRLPNQRPVIGLGGPAGHRTRSRCPCDEPSNCKGGCDKDVNGTMLDSHGFRFATSGRRQAAAP